MTSPTLRWPGRRATDIRWVRRIDPDELPWPLWFSFVRAQNDDGTLVWVCTGYEVGGPIVASDADTSAYELTPQRRATIEANFDRYRLIAEQLLMPTPTNIENADRLRRAGKPKPGDPQTPEGLALLVADWRRLKLAGDPAPMTRLENMYGVTRFQIRRRLERAESIGLLLPGELKRRRDGHNA